MRLMNILSFSIFLSRKKSESISKIMGLVEILHFNRHQIKKNKKKIKDP